MSAADFDFWLGSWRVNWGDDAWGTNQIRKILDDRVILEEFDGRPGTTLRGFSLSTYDAEAGLWHQTWVDDQGLHLQFEGGFAGAEMKLLGEREGEPYRMRWCEIRTDALTWLWERQTASGRWETLWRLAYERAPTEASTNVKAPSCRSSYFRAAFI